MLTEKSKEGVKIAIIVIICIIVLGFLLYYAGKLISENTNNNNNNNNNNSVDETSNATIVSEIIDGDTFKLENGEVVRLICVDTPEKGERGYDEAVSYLGGRLIYENITLERVKMDKYNRTLAWIYVSDSEDVDENDSVIFINKEIVGLGFAVVFSYEGENCSRINS